MTKSLRDILTVVEENDSFIYLNVDDYTKDENRRALVMNGFDGRETYIRITKKSLASSNENIAVTFWWSGKAPENTLTYYFGPDYAKAYTADPLSEIWARSLFIALNELGLDIGCNAIQYL